jgi:RNA polymerase sigma-70 factor (sigma-E family)
VAVQEREAFTEFYEGNRDACLRAVTAVTLDRLQAEELVAESFARAWADWSKLSRHPSPQAWVVRTALNARISWWRKHRREVPLADHDRQATTGVAQLDPSLARALRRLPTRQRDVLILRVMLDLDTETTARVLGIAPGTVMSHLSRAIASLRRDLPPPQDTTASLETRP